MEHLFQDVRYSIRTFFRQPSFALTAILTLALGIGATTAIFSVVSAVVLKPLPFHEPDRVVAVTNFWTRTGLRGGTDLGAGLSRLEGAERQLQVVGVLRRR